MPTSGQSLVGFLNQIEGINHLRAACAVADPSDAALAAEWKVANAKLGGPTPNAGYPAINPIDPAKQPYIDALQQQDWFKASQQSSLQGATFKMVEIEPLLAFQLTVDSSRSNHHNGNLLGPPSLDELLAICLPINPVSEPIQIHQSPGSMMLTSRSLNFHTAAQGFINNNFLGVQVGVSLPLVHVVRHNGKCYLHNGFHRAVGLRGLGVKAIPCVFRDVPSHEAVGIKPGATFQAPLLESGNPPTLAHFTQGHAYDVQLKAFSRTIHISWAEYVTTYE